MESVADAEVASSARTLPGEDGRNGSWLTVKTDLDANGGNLGVAPRCFDLPMTCIRSGTRRTQSHGGWFCQLMEVEHYMVLSVAERPVVRASF